MANNETDIYKQWASVMLNGEQSISKNKIGKASFDRSFYSAIIGINRKFIDSISEDKQRTIIEKFNIPENIEDGENNYYIFIINGIEYCVQQNGDFNLYDSIMVYIPNGDWSRMYIDYPVFIKDSTHTPYPFISDTEPEEGMVQGDYWIEIDSNEDFKSFYIYLPDEETGELKWVKKFDSASGVGVGEFLNDAHNTERFNDYSGNTSNMNFDHVEGYANTSDGQGQFGVNHLENAYNSIKNGSQYIHIEGYENEASQHAQVTHIEGERNIAQSGSYNHLQGNQNTTSGGTANDIGGKTNTVTNGEAETVRGLGNTVTSCNNGFVSGSGIVVQGVNNGVVGGESHSINGALCSAIFGKGHTVNSNGWYSLGAGQNGYNDGRDGKVYYFFIGNGGNIFTVDALGNVSASGTITPGGADYAETYEWLDGNPENEDRRGLFVTLDGKFVKKADSNDDYILGVVSSTPSICGDTYELYWRGKYKTDVFGKILLDDKGERVLSDDFDPSKNYIPQSQRPEKDYIGTVGKLVVVDDGTCVVNKYCKPSDDGIGTFSDNKNDYRVIERLDDTHIKIVMK